VASVVLDNWPQSTTRINLSCLAEVVRAANEAMTRGAGIVMTAVLRPTAARLQLLRAVADGRVWHYPAGNGSAWPTDRIDNGGRLALVRPSYTMTVIEGNGLATHPPTGTNTARVRWDLTEAGRAVLDADMET
jgi:hypothetical protein